MLELRVNVDPHLIDALGACLLDAGAGGIEEQDDEQGTWLVVYCEDAAAEVLHQAVEDFRVRAAVALPEAELGGVLTRPVDSDWQRAWLAAAKPERLTERFVLRPTHAKPAPLDEETLWFEPATCFGAGDHPTTQLAARAVEHVCRARAEANQTLDLLDVGTGNGVLCFVAARSGARQTLGIDIDPAAVEAARYNAALNALAPVCSFEATPVEALSGRFEVVVANIDAPTLVRLAPELLARVGAGGVLLLTGLLDEQEAQVGEVLDRLGAAIDSRQRAGDWVLLAVTPPPDPAPQPG